MKTVRSLVSRVFPLLILLLVLGAPAAAEERSSGCEKAEIAKGSHIDRSIDVGGVSRSFILDVPEVLQPGRPVPLILDFHGFGHSAEGVWGVSGFRELGVRERFITVYPQGLDVKLLGRKGAGWDMFTADGNRELAFVKALLDLLERDYCLDLRRIYATGFSNGAFLSHILGCTMAGRIAAIAPVGGGTLGGACHPSRSVPVIIHHGRSDDIVSVDRARGLYREWLRLDGCSEQPVAAEGKSCALANDCRDGASVVYCEGDGAHRWPPEATLRIWEFFVAHPLPVQ